MDPVEPTTHVHHELHGDLVVVAAPGVAATALAKVFANAMGPGTWCITLSAHNRALGEMDEEGVAQATADDFHWVPWSQLNQKEQ